MIYKIEEAGKTWIFHWIVLMLGALKDIDLSQRVDVCFDREDFNSYQKESFEILSDVINVVPNTCDWVLLPSVKPLDFSNNSGLPDKKVPKTDVLSAESSNLLYSDYEFSIDSLPEFRYFSIKIVGSSTNQAYPPRMKDLRVIALA